MRKLIIAAPAFIAAGNPIPVAAAKTAPTEAAVNCAPRKEKVSVWDFQLQPDLLITPFS